MRYSLALLAVAIGVQAAPQASSYSVQPITQISDGQIQAPPATETPAVPSGTEVAPSSSVATETSVVVVPSVVVPSSEAPAVPSVTVPVVVPVPSAPAGNTTVPVVLPSSSAVPSTNGSASVTTGSPSSTGGASSSSPAPSTGAAAVNMVSFGGLALAVAGFVLA